MTGGGRGFQEGKLFLVGGTSAWSERKIPVRVAIQYGAVEGEGREQRSTRKEIQYSRETGRLLRETENRSLGGGE